jgi:uncharacterized membrane protein YhaH (DUF805 family)
MNANSNLNNSNEIPSYQRHKRQSFWQVLFPILLAGLVVLAGLAFLILTATKGDPASQLSGWADTSLIWMLLPVLGLGLVAVLILGVLIFLLARLLKILPIYTSLVQRYFAIGESWVKNFVARGIKPLLTAKGYQAGASQLLKSLFSFIKH